METEYPVSEIDPPRRGMSWLKGIGWTTLILLILVAIGLFWRQHTVESELQKMLAEMDRSEPGWRLPDIEAARDDLPDDENSGSVVVAAAKMLPRQWPPKEFAEDHFRQFLPNEKLSGEDFVLLARGLASSRPALALADKLADLPRGRYRIRHERNPIAIPLPHAQESRNLVYLLVYESMRQNQRGDSKKALRACRAAFNAARSLGDEPFYISQLVRTAGVVHACQAIERTLGQGEPPPEDLAELQKLLEDEDAFADLRTATRGERAMMNGLFEVVERGEIPLAEVLRLTGNGTPPSWLESTAIALWRMDTREDHALYLSLMTRRCQEAQLPMHEQTALEKRFEQEIRALPKNAILSHLLLPAVVKIGVASRRKHAYVRCLQIALAAERFRRDKKVWPDAVEQLRPHYLAAELLDPFDGKPLRYRRVADGVVIYSVGQDGSDDGGKLDRERPTLSGVDIGVRLWDVAQRRQPPRPKQPEAPAPFNAK